MEVFVRTAFPRSISCDNGSNFTAQLSRELYKMLGIKIKYASPNHPEANGMVERFNAVLKKLLHHTINGPEPRQWHNKLKYLLASFREVPHKVTGISPYQLVYGRVGRGPMAVIKDIWMREQNQEGIVKIDEEEYLVNLREDLMVAAEIANENCKKNQKIYVDYYNKWARNKTFQVGQKVIVLIKDSTNKLKARWTGPAEVTAVMSENSYRVLMPNGGVRSFHSNHLRHFKGRVNNM